MFTPNLLADLGAEPGGGRPPILWSFRTYSSWTYRDQLLLTFHVMGDRGINRTTLKNCLAWGLQSRARVLAPISGPPARPRPRTPRTVSPALGTTFCWNHWKETTFSGPPTCIAGKSSYVRSVKNTVVHSVHLHFHFSLKLYGISFAGFWRTVAFFS